MSSRLSSLLVQDGVVSAAKMADALQRQVIQGGALDSNLLETKALDEDTLAAYVGKAASLPMQPTGLAAMGKPLPEVLDVFAHEVAQRFRAVPTTLRSGGVLQVLVTVDSSISDIDSLALVIRQRIEPWVVLEFRLHEAIEKVYGQGMPTRFARLLQRSQKAHEGRAYPAARLIDPIPRFGSLSEVRLSGPPMSEATAALLVSEALAVGVSAPSVPSVPAAAMEKTEALPVPSAAAAPTEKTDVLTVPATAAVSPTEKTEALPVPALAAISPTEKTEALQVPETATTAPLEKTEALQVPVLATTQAAEKTEAMAVPVAVEAPRLTAPAAASGPEALPPPPAATAAEALPATAAEDIKPTASAAQNVAATSEAAAASSAPVADKPIAPATKPMAAVASASSDEPPRSSRSAPSYSGIDQLSMDEWESVSAADWLSVANKIEPASDAASSAPIPELPAAPKLPVETAPRAATAATPPVAKTAAPAAAKAAPASTQSPSESGRRGKKRNKGQPQPTAQAAQQKPAAPTQTAAPAAAPTVGTTASAAPGAAKDAVRPAGSPTQKSLPAVSVKPAAAAATAAPSSTSVPARPATAAATQPSAASKPAVAPVSKPAIVAVGKPVAPSSVSGKLMAPSVPEKATAKPAAAPVASKPQAPVVVDKPQPAAEAPTKARPTAELSVVAKPAAAESPEPPIAATVAAAPAPAVAAVPEPIPEPINSGRLGEPISSTRPDEALSEPPPSSESPEAIDGEEPPRPAPRIALALDESSGATLSLEAARELVAVAADRDAIFEALCRGARSRARFACVLTIHGEVAFGRVALEDTWLDRQLVGRVSVPLDRPSVFRQAAKSRQQHVGVLGDPAVTNDPLRALGRRPPIPGAVLPILLRGRPVALLYLDDDGRELGEALAAELQPLLSEVGQAFHRLVQQSKTGGLGGVADLDDGASPQEVSDTGTSAWRPRSQHTPAPAATAVTQATAEPATTTAETSPPPSAAPAAEVKAAPTVEPAVPVAASEQPTVPLRVDREKKAAAQNKTPPTEKGDAANKPSATATAQAVSGKPEKSEKTEASPKTTGKHGKGSSKSPPSSSVSPTARKDSGKEASKDAKATPTREDWAALIERTSGGDDAAQQALLAGDEAAVQAVVAALPGPLRSQSKSAIGDQQTAQASLLHSPLLSLVLRMGGRAVAPLIARLKQKDTPTRARFFIVQILSEMPVSSALEPLFDSLYDSDEEVRTAAAAALRNFPPSQALSALRARLRDALDSQGDAKRLVATVDALGELRDTVAVQTIIELLDATDPMVADAAGRALQAITKQDFGRSRYRWSGWWRRHQYEPRLQWLLSGLCHDSAMIRSSAQDELFEMSGDVAGYRFDQPSRERESAAKQWASWWQRHGYEIV